MLSPIVSFLGTGAPPAPATSYFSIATATVDSGGASSITFSSIPNTYTHLQIRAEYITGYNYCYVQFNGDTGTNYSAHNIYATGTGTPGAGGSASQSQFTIGISNTTSYPSVAVADILDYSNTNKYKTTRSLAGTDTNSTGTNFIVLYSGLWMNTSAINSITLTTSGSGFSQYTQFALYGVK